MEQHLKKELHVVTLDRKVNNFLVHILDELMGDQIHIRGFCYEMDELGEPADLVVTSGKFLVPSVRKYYPHTTIIGSKRIINGNNLEKLFSIPEGTKVLVVNHPEVVTLETIESLKIMGITHLEYIPYWKGADVVDELDTAISAGMLHLCPDEILHRIDIGMRTIAFTTLIKIIQHLGLDQNKLDIFADQYIKVVVNGQKRLSDTIKTKDALKNNQQQIIDNVEQSIVLTEDERVLEFNPESERLFHVNKANATSMDMQSLFRDFPEFTQFYEEQKEDNGGKATKILDFQGKKLLTTHIPLKREPTSDPATRHSVFIFNEVDKIQELEKELRAELHYKRHTAKYGFQDIIFQDPKMEECIRKARRIARSDSNVLITGESGTGKELVAQAIHQNSRRWSGPFVAVNFAALPGDLIESELFGYEEGAFTGARKGGKKGLFEQAHGGTIFLDEIADTSPTIQARLLRVLQEREIMRLGGNKILPINIRVLVATNKNLSQMVEEGCFREDLYYRLKILPIEIPPLRERKEDLTVLLRQFLKDKDPAKEFSQEVVNRLHRYAWPGNVRELENLVEYLVCLNDNRRIKMADLPEEFLENDLLEEAHKDHRDGEESGKELLAGFYQPELLYTILRLIYDAKKHMTRIGRRSLLQHLKEHQFDITENKLRNVLNQMEAEGLITAGRTRQGTAITRKGERLLGEYELYIG